MRLRKFLLMSVLSCLYGASGSRFASCTAADAVWRSSRSLRMPVAESQPLQSPIRGKLRPGFVSSEDFWQIRSGELRRLRAALDFARAEANYLEARLQSYRVFRFSDGMLKPIAQTQLALAASRATVAEIEAQIRWVSRAE